MFIKIKSALRESLILVLVIHSMLFIAGAAEMSSSNFKIVDDSINAGGQRSASTNYALEDTAGEVATGQSNSTNYVLKAGYQQMQETFISLSGVTNVNLSPSLGGITGGVSSGTLAFNVVTDSPAGYSVLISAANTPAMQSASSSINNYVPASTVPDFNFTVGAGAKVFGFSPEGTDIVARYRDQTGNCGVTGGDTAFSCWDGLSTSTREIARAASANQPSGATTTVRFRVGISNSAGVTPGVYTATTTITAVPI